jgi:hypothetical protein
MVKKKAVGNLRRKAVKARSQIKGPVTGPRARRDDRTGKLLDVKTDAFPFEGVRKVSDKELRESSDRFAKALTRLAKR